jgi:Prealbumin-like fold domain
VAKTGGIRYGAIAAALLACLAAGALSSIALARSSGTAASASYYYYCPNGGSGSNYGYCPPTTTTTTTPPPSHLIVIKHVVNDNSGSSSAADFTITVSGNKPSPASFPGAEAGTNVTIDPGSYSVTESGPAGYVAFFSSGCSGSIGVGETKTCTITNNDIAPRVTPGYWKTHQAATNALLPQKVGNYTVTTFADAQAVFNAMSCSSSKASDLIGCLAGQLLAAELNLANASDPCITPTVNKANSFLSGGTVTAGGQTATGVNYTGPSGTYTLSAAQRAVAETLKNALDRYNNSKKDCQNP